MDKEKSEKKRETNNINIVAYYVQYSGLVA